MSKRQACTVMTARALPAARAGSPLPAQNAAPMSLQERFCRYVSLDTTAVDDVDRYPSSPGQVEFNRLLAEELRALGCQDVELDANGILTATVPGNREGVPVVAWVAHVDTSPEAPGKDVKPQVHPAYAGGDLVLPGDPTKVLKAEDLKSALGRTVITTDGTTLLGSDDKSGVAVIVEAAERLLKNPELPRGKTRLLFSCDEEVGNGAKHIDLEKLGADVAYTLDGEATGSVDSETFSADLATVTITGVNCHPSKGKGRMVNAVRIASDFIARLPRTRLSPETSDGRQGFLHPYKLEAGVAEATIRIILRDFETEALPAQAELLEHIAAVLRAEHPGASIQVTLTKQYRNMRDGLIREPRAVAYAVEAMRRCGLEPFRTAIRGGTDGSTLTERGLPCPNLSSGQHNLHSYLEWTTVEEMEKCVDVLLELAKVWSEGPDPATIAEAPLVDE